jgi:hypothetical protein
VAGLVLLGFLLFGGKPWNVDLSQSTNFKTHQFVRLWFWPGCLIGFLTVSLLFASAPWWSAPLRSVPGVAKFVTPRWFWPLVLAAAVFLGFCGWQRMDHSLWHDEASRTKSTMVGVYREQNDGTFKFKKIKWEDALFNSKLPNHVLQSAMSKGVHDVWTGLAGTKQIPLSEAALRFPSWVFGISGVVFLAWLLASWGQYEAGVIGAWLLALHPWYLRYASEARGYMVVMALLPLLLLAFQRAAQSGLLRWWVVFALTQTAMVYAYVTSLYIPLVLNLLAPIVLFSLRKQGLDFAGMITKWMVANVLSGTLFVILFLPNAPQLLAYLKSDKGQGLGNVMDALWVQNFFGHLMAGIPWSHTRLEVSRYLELMPQWHSHPLGVGIWISVLAGLVIGGVIVAFQKGGFPRLAAVVFVLPAVLSFAETKLRGGFLYEWYLVYVVPGVVALVALALMRVIQLFQSARWAGVACVAVFLLVFATWTHPQRAFLMSRSLQPYRESVLLTRPSLDPNAPGQSEILTAFVHAGPLFYDPRIERCRTVADMRALMQKADQENKALFFNLGFLETVVLEHPSKFRLLNDPALFEEVAYLQGIQPSCSQRVFRYVSGSSRTYDFSRIPEDHRPERGWTYQ